ncbi:RTA1 like protein-domain-containing protein [Aspergillus heterothallicus]
MSSTTTASSTSASATSTETCIPMTPNKVGFVPPGACGNILMYEASFAAAILFSVLFGFTTLVHIVQAFVYKKRYAWVVIMGSLWELGAFITRTLFSKHQTNETYNTVFTILFLLAPIWVNAFLYMTLGRLIHFFLPSGRLCGLSAKRFGHIFVWLEILAFLVQLVGAGFTSNTDASPATIMRGVHIYMGGIGLQQFFIFVFTGLFIHLQREIAAIERRRGEDVQDPNADTRYRYNPEYSIDQTPSKDISYRTAGPWRWLFIAIYASLFLISVRIIFRLAQYARGTDTDNPALLYEWFEYVWDAAPMFLALVILNVVHPGRVLRGPESEFPRLSRKEKKQRKREKKEAREYQKIHGVVDPGMVDMQERGVSGREMC